MNVRIYSYKQIWNKQMSEYIPKKLIQTNICDQYSQIFEYIRHPLDWTGWILLRRLVLEHLVVLIRRRKRKGILYVKHILPLSQLIVNDPRAFQLGWHLEMWEIVIIIITRKAALSKFCEESHCARWREADFVPHEEELSIQVVWCKKRPNIELPHSEGHESGSRHTLGLLPEERTLQAGEEGERFEAHEETRWGKTSPLQTTLLLLLAAAVTRLIKTH